MSKNGDKEAKFISNIPKLDLYIVQKWLDINNLRWKDAVTILSRMVLKRSFWDSFRSGGGPPGLAEMDDHFITYLEEQAKKGGADPELVDRYKNLSIIERHSYHLKPVTRSMLKEIAEDIESGKLSLKEEIAKDIESGKQDQKKGKTGDG